MNRNSNNRLTDEFASNHLLLTWINETGMKAAHIGTAIETTVAELLEETIKLARQSVPKNCNAERCDSAFRQLSSKKECDEDHLINLLCNEGVSSLLLQTILHARTLQRTCAEWEDLLEGVNILRTLQTDQLVSQIKILQEDGGLDEAYEHLTQRVCDLGYDVESAKEFVRGRREVSVQLLHRA